ncbi:MAG: MBOAT family protein [Clostridia bacterium]|nr:MBOAT family protein [Clostridia bacterium]
MVFSSLPFLFFFLPAVLIAYFAVPDRAKNAVLLIVSLLFYGYGEPVYILLMAGSILLNYFAGRLLGVFSAQPKKKKAVLVLCVIVNLLLLGFFKYATLFVSTLKVLPAFSFLPDPQIALPIGISFYTFQSMSYVIDAYRGNCAPQKNLVTFGTYVALFPQLIAGPIVRYVDVEKQLQTRTHSWEKTTNGVRLFLFGLCKKVLLANALGAVWDQCKAAPGEQPTLGAWVGILAFTFQIFFDFSGYSDMAVGLGKIFGFEFVRNFNYPYTADSITDFWRRWHISLGTWFREYVYIPLGGNRKGKARQCVNIFIVWALTGIWHGASWNFLLWGLYFGVLLTIEKFGLLRLLKQAPKALSRAYTFLLVVLGWVLFDFTALGDMGAYFSSMFTAKNGLTTPDALALLMTHLPLLLCAAIFSAPTARRAFTSLKDRRAYRVLEPLAGAAAFVLCTASLVSSTYNPFLYFRF